MNYGHMVVISKSGSISSQLLIEIPTRRDGQSNQNGGWERSKELATLEPFHLSGGASEMSESTVPTAPDNKATDRNDNDNNFEREKETRRQFQLVSCNSSHKTAAINNNKSNSNNNSNNNKSKSNNGQLGQARPINIGIIPRGTVPNCHKRWNADESPALNK